MTQSDTGIGSPDEKSKWEKQKNLELTSDPYWAMHSPDLYRLDMRKFGGTTEVENVLIVGRDPGSYRLPQGFMSERIERPQIVMDGERRLIGQNPFSHKSSITVVQLAQTYEEDRIKITNPARRLNSDIQVNNSQIQHSETLPDYVKSLAMLEERGGVEIQGIRSAVELAEVIKKEAQEELKVAARRIKGIVKQSRKIRELQPPTYKGSSEIATTQRARKSLEKAKERKARASREYVVKRYGMLSDRAQNRWLYAGDMATVVERVMVNNHVLNEEYEERNRRDRDADGLISDEVLPKRDNDLKKQRVLWRDIKEEVGISDSRVDVSSGLWDKAKGGLGEHSARLVDYRFIVREQHANKAMFDFIVEVSSTHKRDESNQLDGSSLKMLTGGLSNPAPTEVIARLEAVSTYLAVEGVTELEDSMKMMIERKTRELKRIEKDEEYKREQRKETQAL